MEKQHERLAPDYDLAPSAPIRRFDVFAEYNRIKNEMKGMPPDQAKGYALWLAKVVAARKFARTPEKRAEAHMTLGKSGRAEAADERFPQLEGKPQTGDLFEREIVDRMGRDFYRRIFSPTIYRAVEQHEPYQAIRDRLRVPWNLSRAAA